MAKKPKSERTGASDSVDTPRLDKSDAEILATVDTQSESRDKRTQEEWEADRREVASAKHEALDRFVKSTVIQRADLLRDCLVVSVTALIGALTLYYLQNENLSVKSKPLFFLGTIVISVGIIVNLLARIDIITHLQSTSFQIEDRYLRLFQDSRSYLSNRSQTNLDTVYRTEFESSPFPPLSRLGDRGHKLSVWSLILGVVLIALSLVLQISIK